MKPDSDFCRLCQNEEGAIIFKDSPDLINCIIKFLHIEVQYDHKCLPNKICISCVNKLKSTSIFIEMVQEINHKLNVWLKEEYLQKVHCDLGPVQQKASKSDDSCLNELNLLPKLTEKALYEKISNETANTEDSFKCFVCFKIFKNSANFKNHKLCHVVLNCKICKEVFDSEIERSNHFCIKQSKSKKEMENTNITTQMGSIVHMNSVPLQNDVEMGIEKNVPNSDKIQCNNGSSKCYLCQTCGKTFRRKNSLSCHEKIHIGEKLHCCQQCNLTFTLRGNLVTHIKRHHEGQKFFCSQCTKEFLSKDTLLRHEKTHLGLREFACEACPKAFYTSKELKKHQRYHQGLKLFKCEQCFKSFFERHHLIVHVRRHTGERPFSCTIIGCEKSFFEKQKLKRHINQCHMKPKI